jgi:hypothetical protein
MDRRSLIIIIATSAIAIAIIACASSEPSTPGPTAWIGVVNCPECDGNGLVLWEKIDEPGNSPEIVFHGDTCTVIDKGVMETVEITEKKKYKLNCSGKIGWLRAGWFQPR